MTPLTWTEKALFDPESRGQASVFLFILILIVISIVQLSISAQYTEFYNENKAVFLYTEWAITLIFTAETIARIITRPRPKDYLLTPSFLIDILAILPTWLGLFISVDGKTLAWLRGFRMIRLLRTLKFVKHIEKLDHWGLSLISRIGPYMALAFSIKALLIYSEGIGYWPSIPGLGTVVSVVGFAIGVLLSTKLATVQNRMYNFEEQITNLIGSAEAAKAHIKDATPLNKWIIEIHQTITKQKPITDFENENQSMKESFVNQIPGPIWLGLHQSARLLLHKTKTKTPEVYDSALKNITIIYISTVILTIPGLTGLLASFLVVYVLGGLFIVIDSMDLPYDPSENALINSDLSTLEEYIERQGLSPNH
ncbi:MULTISPECIES: ion transporter [Halomonadaceae]|uniref:Ion transport domain-containing protein n=1 Tax=Vreelandella halophila TaxID=86177 RepID=A0A9X5B605_9GAMM|nr:MULTISPECIES: ion transporter [Halomonas]MYL28166.1 hypothetical protein [Halomonas utahensis]